MTDLVLDPAIRSWVFVPIILTAFLVGIIRHYAYLLLLNRKKSDLQNVKDRQVFEFNPIFSFNLMPVF